MRGAGRAAHERPALRGGGGYCARRIQLNPKSAKANYQLGLLLARTGRKDEADRQLELAKSLREEDEASSRLQLRLLDPDSMKLRR